MKTTTIKATMTVLTIALLGGGIATANPKCTPLEHDRTTKGVKVATSTCDKFFGAETVLHFLNTNTYAVSVWADKEMTREIGILAPGESSQTSHDLARHQAQVNSEVTVIPRAVIVPEPTIASR